MRLATWNVNSVLARLPRLLEWLTATSPDVLCLQETKTSVDVFPTAAVRELGYEVAVAGQGRWNGVAVLLRVGLADVAPGFDGAPTWDPDTAPDAPFAPGRGAVEARAVGATCDGIRVWSLYVPNGRQPDSPHYAYKLAWLTAYREAIVDEVAGGPFVALGDFNVAPTDADVWDVTRFAASTHVTESERAALTDLRGLGLRDVMPRPLKHQHPYTFWDYRAGAFHKNMGMRIDLVYANDAVADAVTDAYVDRDARKGKGASDHAPVVVDLDV